MTSSCVLNARRRKKLPRLLSNTTTMVIIALLSPSHPFRSMSTSPHIPEIWWCQNFTMQMYGQGHGCVSFKVTEPTQDPVDWRHSCFTSNRLWYSYFKIWPWKSRVKVMAEVKCRDHVLGSASSRLTPVPLHINRTINSWDTAISKFDLGNLRPWSWWRSKVEVTKSA